VDASDSWCTITELPVVCLFANGSGKFGVLGVLFDSAIQKQVALRRLTKNCKRGEGKNRLNFEEIWSAAAHFRVERVWLLSVDLVFSNRDCADSHLTYRPCLG
jgi:hypothetical protein